jgi:hypothetical protein
MQFQGSAKHVGGDMAGRGPGAPIAWILAWLFLCAPILAVASNAGARAEDADARARFLNDYAPHVEGLKNHYSNARFRVVAKSISDAAVQTDETEGIFDHEHFLFRGTSVSFSKKQQREGPRSAERVSCRNRQYSFDLSRGNDGQYKLIDLKLFGSGELQALCYLTAPYADYNQRVTLLDLAQDPKQEFVSYSDANWHGKKAREITVRNTFQHPQTKQRITDTSSYYFSPTQHWVCVGWRHWGPDRSTPTFWEKSYIYDESGEEFPALRRLEDWDRIRDDTEKGRLFRSVEVVDFVRLSKVDESQFQFSAFGLPEPFGLNPK